MEDNNYDKIQAYLRGEMNPTDKRAFEQNLAVDPGLKLELALHRMADDSIELLIEHDLRHTLDRWSEASNGGASDTASETGGGRVVFMRMVTRRLAIAASVLLVLGFLGGIYMGNQYSDSALADTFFQQSSGLRSGIVSGGALAEGITLLEAEQFAEAEAFFGGSFDESFQTEVNYYKGLAQFGQDKYEDAMDSFASVITDNDARFREKAEFNYLLATMGAGQAETDTQFANLIKSIQNNPDHLAYREVQEMGKKRNAFWRYFSL